MTVYSLQTCKYVDSRIESVLAFGSCAIASEVVSAADRLFVWGTFLADESPKHGAEEEEATRPYMRSTLVQRVIVRFPLFNNRSLGGVTVPATYFGTVPDLLLEQWVELFPCDCYENSSPKTYFWVWNRDVRDLWALLLEDQYHLFVVASEVAVILVALEVQVLVYW